MDAYWFFDYQGDPTRPHALLTSGKHSDGYVDCLKLLKYPKATQIIVEQLVRLMIKQAPDPNNAEIDLVLHTDWVFGSPMAGVSLAYAMAERLGARAGFTDKVPDEEGGKKNRFNEIRSGENVLLVEELVTTMKTVRQQRQAIRTVDGQVPLYAHVLGVFFNRSGETILEPGEGVHGTWPIVSVVEQKITTWEAAECPLCQRGSEAIRPKGENWAKLVGSKA